MSPCIPALCPGLQWLGAPTRVTCQERGADYNNLVKEHLPMFCCIADIISRCLSFSAYTFSILLLECIFLQGNQTRSGIWMTHQGRVMGMYLNCSSKILQQNGDIKQGQYTGYVTCNLIYLRSVDVQKTKIYMYLSALCELTTLLFD